MGAGRRCLGALADRSPPWSSLARRDPRRAPLWLRRRPDRGLDDDPGRGRVLRVAHGRAPRQACAAARHHRRPPGSGRRHRRGGRRAGVRHDRAARRRRRRARTRRRARFGGAAGLECDTIVLLDVGGDVLAHGDEPGLASPLCDAIVLSAGLFLAKSTGVIAAVYGPGWAGELPPDEVLQRITELQSADALLGAWGLTPKSCDLVEAAAKVVPTEASLMAVRCARGERGEVPIRGGRRSVHLTPLGALTFFFDPAAAAGSAIPLATAVSPAASLEEAHDALTEMGVRTELELERERARTRE